MLSVGALSTGAVHVPAAFSLSFDPDPSPAWTVQASLEHPRFQHTSTLLNDGRILVVGGRGPSGQPMADVEILSVSAGNVISIPASSMSTARGGHTATLLRDGTVLVTGGFGAIATSVTSTKALASTEIYHPTSNQWSTAAAMSTPRTLHTATLLLDGRVLVVGHEPGAGLTNPEVYDPQRNMWSATGAPVFSPIAGHSATLLNDGRVLVVGGVAGTAEGYLSRAEVFDPSSNAWTAAPSLTTARSQHSAVRLLDGRVLIVGGVPAVRAAEVYDPNKGAWLSGGQLSLGRFLEAVALLPDGRVIVAGGYSTDSELSSVEAFDPSQAAWSGAPGLPSSIALATATSLPDGAVLIIGGVSGTGSAASSVESLQ